MTIRCNCANKGWTIPDTMKSVSFFLGNQTLTNSFWIKASLLERLRIEANADLYDLPNARNIVLEGYFTFRAPIYIANLVVLIGLDIEGWHLLTVNSITIRDEVGKQMKTAIQRYAEQTAVHTVRVTGLSIKCTRLYTCWTNSVMADLHPSVSELVIRLEDPSANDLQDQGCILETQSSSIQAMYLKSSTLSKYRLIGFPGLRRLALKNFEIGHCPPGLDRLTINCTQDVQLLVPVAARTVVIIPKRNHSYSCTIDMSLIQAEQILVWVKRGRLVLKNIGDCKPTFVTRKPEW